MEMELLIMGDGYDRSYSPSASSSPKRPRTEDGSSESGQGNARDSDTPVFTDQQHQPVKKRRTERRVPSVEARKAALRELNARRVSKGTRQTTDTNPPDAEKSKNKSRKSTKQKSPKEPRRLADHGELFTGRDRLDESEIEFVPS